MQAAKTGIVTRKTRSVRPLGLHPVVEARCIGKAGKPLCVNFGQRLTPAEYGFLQNRVGSCDRHLANLAKNITRQDRALLEKYVRDIKVRMIRALTLRNPQWLTPKTLHAMDR